MGIVPIEPATKVTEKTFRLKWSLTYVKAVTVPLGTNFKEDVMILHILEEDLLAVSDFGCVPGELRVSSCTRKVEPHSREDESGNLWEVHQIRGNLS